MIKKLFSSQVMFSLLSEFFKNQNQKFSISDLTKLTGKKQPNIKREIDKLLTMKFLNKDFEKNINYFSVNKDFIHYTAFDSFFDNYFRKEKKYVLLAEEGGASFLTMQYVMDGFFSDYAVKDDILDFTPELFAHFKNNYFKAYMEDKQVDELCLKSLNKLKTDPSFVFNKIYPTSISNGEKAFSIFNHLKKNNFKVDRKKSVELIDNFRNIIIFLSSYNLIAALELKDQSYSNYLKEYLKRKTKGVDMRHFYAFEKLLAPEHMSYTQFFKMDLLKFVIDGKKNDDIKEIYKNWAWLNFGYRGPGLTYSYILENIKELRAKKEQELLKELKDLKSYVDSTKRKKTEIFKKLKIDLKHQGFVKALSVLSFLKVYRKDVSFLINYCTFKLIDNFKNKNESINFHYMTLDELKEFILNRKMIKKEELSKREQESLYHSDFKNIFVGDDARKFLKKLNIKEESNGEDSRKIKLLDGMTACLGETGNWVYGQVKIVNSPTEINKMKEGDILVSVATTPDILLAMKKASAIVTDHGGITCHAAIVSRELNKPCLIGTKYATKVFKDGDDVVVCPRHGYIKFQ